MPRSLGRRHRQRRGRDGAGLRSGERSAGTNPHGQPFDCGIQAVAITPDGSRVISAPTSGPLRAFDLATGTLERSFGSRGAHSLAITVDGTRVVTADGCLATHVWNLATGELEETLEYPPGVWPGSWLTPGCSEPSGCSNLPGSILLGAAVTPDGTGVVTFGHQLALRLWDISRPRRVPATDGHEGPVWAVAANSDGSRIVSGGEDGVVLVWDGATGRVLCHLDGNSRSITSVAVTPDGTQILSGDLDGVLRIWDLATGRREGTLDGSPGPIRALAVSPDGKQVAAGGWPDSAWVWDLASRLVARKLDTHRGLVHSIAFRPGDKGLIAGDESGTLHLWPERGHPWEFKGEAGAVRAIALTPDGRNSSTGERATWPASGTSWRTGAC